MIRDNTEVSEMGCNISIDFKNHRIVRYNIHGTNIKVTKLDVFVDGNSRIELDGLACKHRCKNDGFS